MINNLKAPSLLDHQNRSNKRRDDPPMEISAVDMPLKPLKILYQDDTLIAIDKPSGWFVHRSPLDPKVTEIVLQRLRDQVGAYLYPVHRLDRPTSGVLCFALDQASARALGAQFMAHSLKKEYLALVRGYVENEGMIDSPLSFIRDKIADRDRGEIADQEAITFYHPLAQCEIPLSTGKYPTSRYTLLSLIPKTGRKHQLRRHMNHFSHPIVGDSTYGDLRHNRLFREHYDVERLLLHAYRITLAHPKSGEALTITAPLDNLWITLLTRLGWDPSIITSTGSHNS